uniref:Uncharacterized protein n=1 Tax=Sus scrofa TaxID=9823 RepID=A0A8W4FF59_PIG
MALIMLRNVPSIPTLVRVFIINGCWALSRHHQTPRREHSKTFSDINLMNIFSGQSPKATEIRAKINQWDLIKLKSFCTAMETKKKTKRQLTEWEKIVSNDATDKGLISKIYEKLKQLSSKKSNSTIENWAERPEKTILHGRYTNGQQAHEKRLNIPGY